MNLPEDLLYSKNHEWIKKEGNNVRIGVSDYAQSELGDIVFVELPEEDDDIELDEDFGSIESVKAVTELTAPVKGKIIEVNEELEDNPELVNESPYEDAWIVVVELADESELDDLLSVDDYKALIEEE